MATTMQFKIKIGKKENLGNAPKENGCFYICEDTRELFTCVNGEILAVCALGEFDPARVDALESTVEAMQSELTEVKENIKQYVFTINDLPTIGNKDVVYIVEADHAIYAWSETEGHYICVGRDVPDIEIIDGNTDLT